MSRDEIERTREVKGATQREAKDVQKRALRRVGTASSALNATPRLSSHQPRGRIADALGECSDSDLGPLRGRTSSWIRGAVPGKSTETAIPSLSGRRRPWAQLVPGEAKILPQRSARRPAGPPFLLLIPLYDWRNEGLHEVFDGLSVQLDEASGIDVLIEIVASPADLHACYQSLRSAELAKRDEADARAYARKLRKGSSAETDRRIEVDKLAKRLGIPPEKLPCIAVLPFPLSLSVEAVKIDEDWFKTERSPKQLATALEGFFKSQSVRELIAEASTNLDLAKEYSGLMRKWLARRVRVERVKTGRPRKRAARTIAIDSLTKAMVEHHRAARDHAESKEKMNEGPELLPRPTQRQLAAQCGLSRSSVSRALGDSNAHALQLLWKTATSINDVMRYKSP